MSGPLELETFFRWVRTCVAHFLGKRNLEVYTARLASVKLNKRPEIRVFSVRGETYLVPAWNKFEDVIRNALTDTSEKDATEIIRNLRDKITTGKGLNSEAQRSVGLMGRIIKHKQATCTLIMHCEAVIAAILESGNFAKLSEVLLFSLYLNMKIFTHVFPELRE
jgi:hypothetical protein